MSHQECSVCYEPCAKLSVTCCNGHTICEKHYLQRYKAIYQEGRQAFHDDNAQSCFLCRTEIGDDEFSLTYHKNMKLVICQGMLTKNRRYSNKNFHIMWKKRSQESKGEEEKD